MKVTIKTHHRHPRFINWLAIILGLMAFAQSGGFH